MRNILHIFFSEKDVHPWAVLGCLLAASLIEGISVTALLPLLSLATGADGSGDGSSAAFLVVEQVLSVLGLSASLANLVLFVVAGVAIKASLTFAAMVYVGSAVAEVATSLRTRLVEALLNARWSYFVAKPTGRILNTLSVDATRAGQAYLAAAIFLAHALKTGVYLVVAFVISWRLALAAVIIGGTISLGLNALVRMAKRAGRRQTDRTADLLTYFTDTLNSVKPLKAMARQESFAALLHRKIGALRKALRKQVISRELLRNASEVMFVVALGAGFLAAVHVWQVGVLQLLVTGLILERTVTNVRKMQAQLQEASILESAHMATRALISDTEAARERASGTRTPMLERGCRFERVSFCHGRQVILKRASFELPARSLSVLIGPSGAGKTTLADLLIGFYEPDQGRILIDDVPLADLDMRRWRAEIGYVAQDLILLHDTVFANLTLGDPCVDESQAREVLEIAGAWDFVAALPEGLMTGVGEKGIRFSGGQRQRIALARALISRPRLLILDEVTSALDPQTERELWQRIAGLTDRMTILAIGHRPVFLEVADQILHLDRGRLRQIPPAQAGAAVAAT